MSAHQQKQIAIGMVGGGPDSGIGETHRIAMRFCSVNGPVQTFAQGTECVSDEARRWTRGGLGHPEGYFEAFANLYSELADVIGAEGMGRDPLGFPDALDGAKGLAFVEAFLRSYRSGGTWATVDTV